VFGRVLSALDGSAFKRVWTHLETLYLAWRATRLNVFEAVNSQEMGNRPSEPQTLLELSLFAAAKLAQNFETYNCYVRIVSLKDLGLPQRLFELLWKKAQTMSDFALDHAAEMEDDTFVTECFCDTCFNHTININTGKISLDCQCDNCLKVINPALLIRYTRLATLRKNERRFHYSIDNTYNSDDCSIIERLSKLKQRQLKKQMKKSV